MNEIFALNEALMARAETVLLTSTEDIEREIWRAVNELLRQFKTQSGHFVPEEATARLINSLKGELMGIIKRSSLPGEMDKYFHNFDEIGDNVRAAHKKGNGISVPKSLVNRQKQFAIDSTVFTMMDGNVSLKFVDPIKRALFNHVNFGAGVLDAETELRAMILGGDKKLGVLRQWVGQVARDAIHQYQGGINQRVAVEYELNAWRYVGSVVEDSRPQCKRWMLIGTILNDDLEKEIRWAKRNGSGMISETTPGTFAVYRGGHNCQHTAYPVRE